MSGNAATGAPPAGKKTSNNSSNKPSNRTENLRAKTD